MVGSRESKQNFTEILEEIIKIIMKRMKRWRNNQEILKKGLKKKKKKVSWKEKKEKEEEEGMSSGEEDWIALKLTKLWGLLKVEPEWSEVVDGAADSAEPEVGGVSCRYS